MTNTEQPGLDAGALEAARATFRKTTWEDDTAKAVVSAYLAALPAPDTVGAPTPFPYQKTFDAIAAATKIEAGHISISVTAFKEAFLASPLQLDEDRSFAASIEAQASVPWPKPRVVALTIAALEQVAAGNKTLSKEFASEIADMLRAFSTADNLELQEALGKLDYYERAVGERRAGTSRLVYDKKRRTSRETDPKPEAWPSDE